MSKRKTPGISESSENEVRFRCVAPGAQSVFLAGTFNGWDPSVTPMQMDQSGEWHVTIELSPGRYEYKFIVDGIWGCEPGVADELYAREDAILNAFGTKNRVIEVE